MCLSIAVDDPSRVLNQGEHLGFKWIVTHNDLGYRCGYVRVPAGHPWHGVGYDDVRQADGDYADVHGGLTFAAPDRACDKGGPDDAWWLGFDCAHSGDGMDPALPRPGLLDYGYLGRSGHIWTQAEVEADCRSLCEQAAKARPVGVEVSR